jgi:ketosteroid isomerase-like protein
VGQALVDSILVHAADGRHVWVTRQGLNAFLTETPEFSWDISSIDYVGHSDGKDVVVVRGQEKRSYADGRVFDEHLAEFFEWKDGRIVEVTQYRRTP